MEIKFEIECPKEPCGWCCPEFCTDKNKPEKCSENLAGAIKDYYLARIFKPITQ
ncbi:MAG: hypothetical protein LBM93_15160 [Oscillospiraceae bacterium]|jgi:hypothetical protein|nr:hypothetical protein [Oscillospiraceae bacterium]